MPEHQTYRVFAGDVRTHPAYQAWNRMSPAEPPSRITALKQLRKSSVYRLESTNGSGNFIAKRCKREQAEREQRMYEEILPALEVDCLRTHGIYCEPDGDFAWLFLEDAGEQGVMPDLSAHRELVMVWLATMHAAAAAADISTALPLRDTSHYYQLLLEAQLRLNNAKNNPVLGKEFLECMDRVLKHLGHICEEWPRIEREAAGMPRTLVHGDFVAKNLRLLCDRTPARLLVLDWEEAGWGMPGPDLANWDAGIESYQSVGAYGWIYSVVELRQMAALGKFFRLLAAVNWETWNLDFDWSSQRFDHVRIYEQRLSQHLKNQRAEI